MRRLILALGLLGLGFLAIHAYADEGHEVTFKASKADSMYFEGFSRDHPPTPAQAAILRAKDPDIAEFAEYGINPYHCSVWWSADARCFQDEYFKCWDS